MKIRNGLVAVAAAACAFAFAGSASAAPMSSAAAPSANAAASLDQTVTDVRWERRRRCHRGHCHWKRVWVPGISIQIGPRHRHRHHRHHRRHRH